VTVCGSCQASNADGAKFCSSCGSPLARACPGCGAPAAGRFCSECGTPLEPGTARAAGVTAPGGPATAAERRITSVLFGDLVGFTALSESRDPDDVRELLSHYFVAARKVVERYGGTVEKFIGDAVMAVWGVPVSHEDDAERAVRAGFDLVDAVTVLGEQNGLAGLAMRVGVVTGEVAVTIGAVGEGMVAGDAVNTAARVQTAAAPGRVWVDEQTKNLTAAAIAYDDEGTHELKGKVEPLHLFSARQVIAAVGGARRVDGLEAPFVGRDRELRLVKELFHATLEEGRPRLVAVFGPAGIGKSRLGWEFDKYYDGINDTVMGHRGRCLSYGEGVAFWALAEMVRGRLGIIEGDANETVVERLRAGLDVYVEDPGDRTWMLPRLATLLGVIELVSPGATFARDDLFAAWRTFLERVAGTGDALGAVLRIDDLQWADPGLLEFIDHVLDTAAAPLFILTLARNDLAERAPSFGTGRRATTLHLEPLPPAAMASLVGGLVDGLPDDLRGMLVERSEGVPLFAVETVRALIDRDAVIPQGGRYVLAPDASERIDMDDRSLPTSLQTLIASRLDGLPSVERRAVQDAAVLGQSFTKRALQALADATGEHLELDSTLTALVRKELFAIESDPRSPERGQYRFVQAMVRTVAYESLSRRDRKERHVAVAAYLAAEPDADTITAVIASHYLDAHAAAGPDDDSDALAACAVDLLEQAAAHARGVGAHAEALRHLQSALALVDDPVVVGRLTEAAADASIATGASREGASLAEKARQTYLDAGLPLDAARALVVWGDAQINSGMGQGVVGPLATEYDALATTVDWASSPEAAAIKARLALGVARGYYLSLGDSEAAVPWFDRAVALAEAMEDIKLLASTLASYAGALVLVGRSRMGLGLLQVSMDLARDLGDPTTQLRPINNLISFLSTRDLRRANAYAKEGIAIARRLGDRQWGAYILGSAAHAYWNAGAWDDVLAIGDDHLVELEDDLSPLRALIFVYVAAVREARGLPAEIPTLSDVPSGMRADVMLEAAQALLDSFRRRAAGDLPGAAALSAQSVAQVVAASGIDDDFGIFWTTAVNDQLRIGAVATAQELVDRVAAAPPGHVTRLLRAMLPWMKTRVAVAAGEDADPHAAYVASEEALREFGAPFYLAQVVLDHAAWLQAGGRFDEAQACLAEAGDLLAKLGAQAWSARIDGSPGDLADVTLPGAPAGT
jgi:class 3 adenylate cyclase/tetratricopeptide (TPR) repeat protein